MAIYERKQIQREHLRHFLGRVPLSLFFAALLCVNACTVPGGNQQISKIRLSIQNTLPIARKKVPIVLTGTQLRQVNADFSFKAYSVVTGTAPREVMVPAQADDLDYDGEPDQLCFLLDLEPEETKEVSILYDPNVKATLTLDLNKQTRAVIFPELSAAAALESNLIAYVLKHDGAFNAYAKKRNVLFSIDTMFQSELDYERPPPPELRLHFENNGITLSQQVQVAVEKPEHRWVLRDLENQMTYFIRRTESGGAEIGQEMATTAQLDIATSIGLSLNNLLMPETPEMVSLHKTDTLIGCGGIAVWDEERETLRPLSTEGGYVRILADGAIRSIVQRIIPAWQVGGETRRLTLTTFIYGENPWIEQHIHVDAALPAGYHIATGAPRIGPNSTAKTDSQQGWLWCWGADPGGADVLGIALVGLSEDAPIFLNEQTEAGVFPVLLTPDSSGRLSYRTFAVWGGGIDGIETESEFAKHVQLTATALKTPPLIKFLPKEESEE